MKARLSAAPIPQSPVFRVVARAPGPRAAIDLANAASTALIAYVNGINQSSPDTTRLYGKLKDAESSYSSRLATQSRLERQLAKDTSRSARSKLVRAATAVGIARDRVA